MYYFYKNALKGVLQANGRRIHRPRERAAASKDRFWLPAYVTFCLKNH